MRPVGFTRAWVEYAARHAPLKKRFSSRARAVDAVRIALLRAALPAASSHHLAAGSSSPCRRWRLERTPSLTRLIPFIREAGGQVESFPEIRETTGEKATRDPCLRREWADRIEFASAMLRARKARRAASHMRRARGAGVEMCAPPLTQAA